jgi:type II secretory pathway pseudopilin PulG
MRQSIVLVELIFVIVLLSIIFLTTTKFLFAIQDKNRVNFTTNLTKIEFETTRLFLINKLHIQSNLNLVSYSDNKIFYNGWLLQDNVSSFIISNDNNMYNIDICIDLYNNICQNWILK